MDRLLRRCNLRYIARILRELSPALPVLTLLIVGFLMFLPFTPSIHMSLRVDGTNLLATNCEYQLKPLLEGIGRGGRGDLQLVGYVLPHSTITQVLHIVLHYNGILVGQYAYNITDGFWKFDVTFWPITQNANVPWIVAYWIDDATPTIARFYIT